MPAGRLVTPGPVDNMVLSNITMINVRSPVYIAFGADAPYSGNNLGVGRIVIDNLTAINCGRTPFYVAGPKEKPAKSIILRNARMTFVGGVNEEESNGQGFSPYSMLQAYGVYARNVENLELHDVRVDYTDKDRRPALFGENIGTLELDRFVAQREPDGAPSLLFEGIRKLIMNGAEATPAKVLMKALDPISGLYFRRAPLRASYRSRTPAAKAWPMSNCGSGMTPSSAPPGWAPMKPRA